MQHVASPRLAAGDAVELAQLLERVDAHVRVGADAEPDPRWSTRSTGRKPSPRFASVVGHAQMRAPACPSRSSSRPSAWVAWTTVVRGPRQPRLGEQLDRAHAVLGDALLDLARLLVGVHVQRQPVARSRSGRAPRASRAGRRARSGGRRRRARRPSRSVLQLAKVVRDGRLPKAVDAAARVGDVEKDELDARLGAAAAAACASARPR